MNKKCSLFIGRWQGIHDGHRWLWNQELKKGKDILIAIQDILQKKLWDISQKNLGTRY